MARARVKASDAGLSITRVEAVAHRVAEIQLEQSALFSEREKLVARVEAIDTRLNDLRVDHVEAKMLLAAAASRSTP